MAEWSPFRAFALKKNKNQKFCWQDIAALLLFGALIIWFLIAARNLPEYNWQWSLLGEFIITNDKNGHWSAGLLLRGFFTTLRIGCWTILFSFIAGGLIGVLAAHKSFMALLPYTAFINLIRNTPPLVILFCIYFFAGNTLPIPAIEETIRQLPESARNIIGLIFAQPGQMDRMIAAILALGSYQAAYVAEIVRGGIESIDNGQWDAAKALGFGGMATLGMIILPQAIRIMLPPLTGQCISTFKDSALASLISLPDLTFQSLEIMAISRMTFEIWISSALLYLIISIFCAWLGKLLENKFSHQ